MQQAAQAIGMRRLAKGVFAVTTFCKVHRPIFVQRSMKRDFWRMGFKSNTCCGTPAFHTMQVCADNHYVACMLKGEASSLCI